MELIIGSHVSFTKDTQLIGCVNETLSYGANTFMFYTGAPQNTNRIQIDDNKTIQAIELMKDNNIDYKNVIVHAPYIINLASQDIEKRDFAVRFLKQEIARCEKLGMTKLVLHPGSHVGITLEEGLNNIIDSLNHILNEESIVDICLETMAGKGNECCYKFEHIKTIIEGVQFNNKIKVCMDTCHINDAGYDVSDFDKILLEFNRTIGLDKLSCIHINDSKNKIGEKKDRHENIGYGNIGFDNLLKIIYNPKIKDIPKILETPYIGDIDASKERKYPPYKFEIDMIINKKFNSNLFDNIRQYYKK